MVVVLCYTPLAAGRIIFDRVLNTTGYYYYCTLDYDYSVVVVLYLCHMLIIVC